MSPKPKRGHLPSGDGTLQNAKEELVCGSGHSLHSTMTIQEKAFFKSISFKANNNNQNINLLVVHKSHTSKKQREPSSEAH